MGRVVGSGRDTTSSPHTATRHWHSTNGLKEQGITVNYERQPTAGAMRRRASRLEMRRQGGAPSSLLGASTAAAASSHAGTRTNIRIVAAPPPPPLAPPFRHQQQPASLHSNKGGRLEGRAEGLERARTSVDEKKNDCACLTCVKRLAGEVDIKWADSQAKSHIRQCLEGDETHAFWTMKPGELYDTNKPFFHQYKYTNFRTNLNALKKSIRTNTEQVEFDEQAFKVESNTFTRGTHTSQGNPYYDTSDARVSLVKDVADSGVVDMYRNTPRLLRATKPEYQCFKPDVFTKHFNREIRRKKEAAGWQHRRNLQGSKNHLQRLNDELEK